METDSQERTPELIHATKQKEYFNAKFANKTKFMHSISCGLN